MDASTYTKTASDKTEMHSDFDSLKRLWTLAGPLRRKVLAGVLFRFAQSFCLGLAFATVIIRSSVNWRRGGA